MCLCYPKYLLIVLVSFPFYVLMFYVHFKFNVFSYFIYCLKYRFTRVNALIRKIVDKYIHGIIMEIIKIKNTYLNF